MIIFLFGIWWQLIFWIQSLVFRKKAEIVVSSFWCYYMFFGKSFISICIFLSWSSRKFWHCCFVYLVSAALVRRWTSNQIVFPYLQFLKASTYLHRMFDVENSSTAYGLNWFQVILLCSHGKVSHCYFEFLMLLPLAHFRFQLLLYIPALLFW